MTSFRLLLHLLPALTAAVAVAPVPPFLVAGPVEPDPLMEPERTRCVPDAPRVDEEGFVVLGGIEQWVTIRGSDCGNPVVLFLHGGPGNPLSPYAGAIYAGWEKEFTLVQWDQRGTARTYGRHPAAAGAALTVEQTAQDGLELASYLIARLNTARVILVGGSWGSVVAVHMAKARPDLFHAYVGAGQLVGYRENQSASYERVVELARAAGDSSTAAALETLGPPPWADPRNAGILRRATRVYEAKTTVPAPESWWVPSPEYATPAMATDRERGEDYSYLQFVGTEGQGMFSRVDLPSLGTDFEVPIFLVQGSEDLVTTPEVARRYFDSLVAPRKEFVLLPRTGHDPNVAMVDAQYQILRTRVAPGIK